MLRKWCVTLVAASGLFLLANPAQAQVVGVSGAAYHDDYATDLFLLRTFVRASGLGIRPTAAVDAYLMSYNGPVYNSGHMVGAITPALGAAYVLENAAIGARAGYTLITEPNPRAGRHTLYVPLDRGVTTAADFYHYGMTPRIEGFVHYHWGPSMLISEGSAHVPLTRFRPFTLEGGILGTWQSSYDDDLRTWLAGPSLRLVQDGLAIGLSGGVRRNGEDSNNRTYLRLGGTYAPFIRS